MKSFFFQSRKKSLVLLLILFPIFVLSIFFATKLFLTMNPDIEALLPKASPSFQAYQALKKRLFLGDELAVLIFSPSAQETKRFKKAFLDKLKPISTQFSLKIETDQKKVLSFFQKHAALYLDLSDLKKIYSYLNAKMHYELALYNPLNIFRTTELKEPLSPFDFLKRKYQKKFSSFTSHPQGDYASKDEKTRLILIYLPTQSKKLTLTKKISFKLQTILHSLQKTFPRVRVHFSGTAQVFLEEERAAQSDVLWITMIVFLCVGLLLVIAFQSILLPTLLLITIFLSTTCVFGIGYFTLSPLNTNSAFLGALILGNGINAGIIFLKRFLEYFGSIPLPQALRKATLLSWKPTLFASLAASFAYGALIFTSFRGFHQFGWFGFLGILACWVATFTLFPAMIRICHPSHRFLLKPSFFSLFKKTPQIFFITSGYQKKVILIAGNFAILLGFYWIQQLSHHIYETDLSKLRSTYTLKKGAEFYAPYVQKILKRDPSPLIVLTSSTQHAEKIKLLLRKEKRKNPFLTDLKKIYTIKDLLPTDQNKKIKIIQKIQALLPPAFQKHIEPTFRKQLHFLLAPQATQKITFSQLPSSLLDHYREKDGSLGNLVLLEERVQNTQDTIKLFQFAQTIRKLSLKIDPNALLIGDTFVTTDLISSIQKEGPKITWISFLAVLLIVAFLFRSWVLGAAVLSTLILGVFWLLALISAWNIKINVLNFIALPMTFGIGVDYGVNLFGRYLQTPQTGILTVLKKQGSAIFLSSLTTIIGYGSLLFAQNQAFVSFGLLSLLGELTCVFSALFFVPIVFDFFIKKHKKNQTMP